MCVVCDNVDKYNEEYPLGFCFEAEGDTPLDSLLSYFSTVEAIQRICIEQIKKKAYKALSNGDSVCDVGSGRAWLKNQCFYVLWAQFKEKIEFEKKRLNEELRYHY